jgi:hypothetical protein
MMLSNNVARAIYVLPIAGYVILYSDYFQFSVFKFSALSSWGFLSFMGRIYLTYYGSVVLLIAFILYWFYSPPLLRNKRDLQHFSSDIIVSRDSSTVHRIIPPTIKYIEGLLSTATKDEPNRVRWERLVEVMQRRGSHIGSAAGEYESDIPNILAAYYDWQNSRMPRLRIFIFILTCSAYLLLILPPFELFLRVLHTSILALAANIL